MTTETRFIDLLGEFPLGPQYDAQGDITPFRNSTTELSLVTSLSNTTFQIIVNDIFVGFVTTDVNGNALFDVILPLGDIELRLERENSTDKIIAYLTTRNTAVWLAAVAVELENIDDAIDLTLNSHRLEKALSGDIELAHGTRLLLPNDFNAGLEAYRESLQLMRQAFRQFSGRLSAKRAAAAAITQINPLIFDRTKTGPRWVLGFNLLPNGDLQGGNKALDGSADLATEINVLGEFVKLIDTEIYSFSSTTGRLFYNNVLKRFKWLPPLDVVSDPFTEFNINFGLFANSQLVDSDSLIKIPTGAARATIHSLHLPHTITANEYDHIYLQVDDFDIVPINLSLGGTLSIDTKINGWLQSVSGYRNASRQDASVPVISENYEIIRVNEYSPTGGTASISTVDGLNMSYVAPGDTIGQAVPLIAGEIVRLFSGNNIDFVDILCPATLPGATGVAFFSIINRYNTSGPNIGPATLIQSSDQLAITSQIFNILDTPNERLGSISIHDGPANAAAFPISGSERGIFDIPKVATILSSGTGVAANTITVPAGTAALFSSSDGDVATPFDIIVGYGYQSFVEPTFTITPIGSGHTATISISGTTFKPNDTHVVVNAVSAPGFSRNIGPHKILSIDSSITATIVYGGIGVAQPSTTTGVSIINISDTSTTGAGTLEYTAVGTTLEWTAPGDAAGTPVNVGAGGYFRIFSSDTTQFIDVLVDSSALPGGDNSEGIAKDRFISQTGVGSDRVRIWSSGERATVDNFATPLDEIWALTSPLVGEYDAGTTVYLANNQFPLREESEQSFGNINLEIDTSFEPTTPTQSEANAISVLGNNLPFGWKFSSGATPFMIHRTAKFSKGSMYMRRTVAAANTFERKIDIESDWCGFEFTAKAWISHVGDDGVSQSHRINIIFDIGTLVGATVVISDPDETIRQPQLIEHTFVIPPEATELTVQLEALSSDQSYIVEKVILVQENFSGLFLGNQTIPRSPGRASKGSLLYLWSPEGTPLTTQENNILGVGSPSPGGLIRETHNAHEEVDAVDVTDIVLGANVNVRGAVTEADWLASTRTNMEVISRTPTRFSYVRPEIINQVSGEQLTFAGGPFTATLAVESDQDQTKAIIFEDGVPITNDTWTFNNSTEVEITSGFNSAATYTIEYQALIQVETAPIDLLVPADNGNDTWLADVFYWNRHKSEIDILRQTVSIIFDVNFVARLNIRSDQDKLNSVLIEDTGVTQRIIPKESWEYVGSLTIRINGAEFNPEAIYNLEYNQQIVDPNRAATIVTEIRSAASVFSLSSATYRTFDIKQGFCVDASLRYHQIRATISNVGNLKDVRIHSAVLRGLNMSGTGSPPPGF